jgi:hypothetical protein
MLRDAYGNTFGLGNRADGRFWVDIEVVPESSPYAYDFSAEMCDAEWQSGARVLRCPSNRNSPTGSIFNLNNPDLEDGRTENEQTLWTRPNSAAGGWIVGVYPPYLVRNNDHFMADIGCLAGNPGCDVIFYLSYQASGRAMQTLGSWHECYDGDATRVVLDISSLAGQAVQFVLSVTNQGAPSDANAFWLVPSIRRVAPTPVPTPQPTQTPDPSNQAVQAALVDLSRRTGVAIGNIRVNRVERVVWDDACLGVDVPGEVCAQVQVPGYRIILSIKVKTFEAHTNQDGSVIYWLRE